MQWGTYIGDSSQEYSTSTVFDSSNNVIIGGSTMSSDIPALSGYDQTFNGNNDFYIAKLSSTGNSLIWATYLGGTNSEYLASINLDSSGNIIISGRTTSSDMPTTGGAYDTTFNGSVDCYIAKLNSSGNSLLLGTYFGGAGSDYLYSLKVDSSDNMIFCGYTTSTAGIATSGSYDTTFNGGSDDMFVTKLRANGNNLLWSTYVGGNNSDQCMYITIDSLSNVYLTGSTWSSNIPTPNGYDQTYKSPSYSDIYIAKLSSNGTSLVWGTYIGGSNLDDPFSIVLDSSGNVVISARTYSSNIPVPYGYDTLLSGYTDFYISKLSSSGNNLLWGTYLGGSSFDDPWAMTIDSYDNIYLTGHTYSNDIPVPNGYDTTYNGGTDDIYVGKLNSNGNYLLWGTYIGGSSDEKPMSIALDSSGDIIVSGWTRSNNIPVPNGYDTTYYSNEDIYVAKLLKSSPFVPGETLVMYAKKSTGTSIELNYTPLYCQTDQSIYWGTSTGNMSGVSWTNFDCLNGNTGTAYFDPGSPAAGSFYYFVIVGNNGTKEGSYGRNSLSIERPQAPSGVKCIENQDISPCL